MPDDQQIRDSLQTYGLSEKQAEVYLACLRLGTCNTQELSRETKIARSTLYSVLESLTKEGLIISFKQTKTTKFSALHPQKLINQAQQKHLAVTSIAPALKNIFNSSAHKPKINYYEGQKQIVEMHWEILKTPYLKTYDILSPVTEFLNFDRIFARDFMNKRANLNISPRIICKDGPEIRKLKQREAKYKFKIKIVPEKLLKNLTSLIYILPKRVVFWGVKKDRIAISIESEEIREPIKVMFNIFWCSPLGMKF